MNNIITVSENAVKQIKKIISSASSKVDGVIVDVDKTGCSGYAYKLDYAKNTDSSKYGALKLIGLLIKLPVKSSRNDVFKLSVKIQKNKYLKKNGKNKKRKINN